MVESLVAEMQLRKSFLKEKISTLYFGGGTPSILSVDEIKRLIDVALLNFDCQNLQEVTLECNPENISESYLLGLKEAGITRISLGIQSLNQAVLTSMNRSHNKEQALYSVELIRKHFDNFSVDLMYGLPASLGENSFQDDLIYFLKNGTPHISLYNLTIEEQTKLYHDIHKGKTDEPSEEQSRKEFEFVIASLEKHGYNHYEISNAAKPGFESKHNSAYWNFSPYVGIGPAAHSFDGRNRFANIANNPQYIKSLREKEIPTEKEILSDSEAFNEILMLGLRQKKGVDIRKLQQYPDLYARMKENRAYKNYISSKVLKSELNSLILQNDGIFLADKICSDLFA
jgi:oxygen-independent coproporphyrinogen-3 oxidase